MITDVAGVLVGQWTDEVGCTGCTAVVLPPGTVASGEVRGGAPGTREFALLEPGRLVDSVDVVLLTGGSAFGLAACDGAMRWCEEQGRGFETSAGLVPIVVGAVIFDLGVGDATARPGPDAGYEACRSAVSGEIASGQVGAGTGATAGKWRGSQHAVRGGVGTSSLREGDLVVGALVVVNSVGDVIPAAGDRPAPAEAARMRATPFENTTIGVVVTNATLDKTGCHLVAQSAHDGLARAIEPAHTRFDGDAIVAAATGAMAASLDVVRIMAARAVEAAVRDAVGTL